MVEEMEQTTEISTTSEHNFLDLISALPDFLLLHILSLLDMGDVMETSLLSRRWRYLWKSIRCLCFQPWVFQRMDITKFIDRCLFHHEGSKIRKLHINFYYKHTHAFQADSWIHFAIRRNVEDFKFHLFGGVFHQEDSIKYNELYKLPRSIYFCGTLTSLTLAGCNLNLPHSFRLGSLKKLSLRHLELHSDSIEHLSSCCPLLEDIALLDCNRMKDINIVIRNEYVKRLEIDEYGKCGFGTIKINAPSLLSLEICDCWPCTKFHVEELGSLISAAIILDQAIDEDGTDYVFGTDYLEGLLYGLRHVKRLKLCSWCLQVLSVREVFRLGPLSISAICIELQTTLTKWELPGISYLLKSCSNLENLEMSRQGNSYGTQCQLSEHFMNEYDFEKEGYWESVGIALPSILQNIKTIKLNGYGCSYEAFVRFLLKNSKVLERMVISSPKRYFNKFEKLFKLSQMLNVFPRCSPNAEVFIT